MVLERWGFPRKIVNAIEFHHEPDKNRGDLLTGILHLADAMGIMLGKASAQTA